MMLRTTLCLLAAGMCVLSGCTRSEISVASQSQSNWLDVDPAAMSVAELGPPPKLLPQTYFAAAQLLESRLQYLQAIELYRRATLVQHRYVAAHHRLGILLGRVGRHVEAVSSLERAVALRPDVAMLHNNLGFEYARVTRWDDAEAALRHAIELQPRFARAQVNLGMVLCHLDRFDEAFDAFSDALPAAAVHYNLGLMYRGQHRDTDAALAFIRALEIDPELTAASIQLETVVEVMGPVVSQTDPLVAIESIDEENNADQAEFVGLEDTLPEGFTADSSEADAYVPCEDEYESIVGDEDLRKVDVDFDRDPVASTVDGVVYADELTDSPPSLDERSAEAITLPQESFVGPPASISPSESAIEPAQPDPFESTNAPDDEQESLDPQATQSEPLDLTQDTQGWRVVTTDAMPSPDEPLVAELSDASEQTESSQTDVSILSAVAALIDTWSQDKEPVETTLLPTSGTDVPIERAPIESVADDNHTAPFAWIEPAVDDSTDDEAVVQPLLPTDAPVDFAIDEVASEEPGEIEPADTLVTTELPDVQDVLQEDEVAELAVIAPTQTNTDATESLRLYENEPFAEVEPLRLDGQGTFGLQDSSLWYREWVAKLNLEPGDGIDFAADRVFAPLVGTDDFAQPSPPTPSIAHAEPTGQSKQIEAVEWFSVDDDLNDAWNELIVGVEVHEDAVVVERSALASQAKAAKTESTDVAAPIEAIEWFSAEDDLDDAWNELIVGFEVYPPVSAESVDVSATRTHVPTMLLDPMQRVEREGVTESEQPALPPAPQRRISRLNRESIARIEIPGPQ